MNFSKAVAQNLLQINAIQLRPQNPFTWASGWKSPIYCDNRTILSYPEVRNIVVDAFIAKSELFQPFDMVAGVATAGIPHGVLLADRLQLPFIYVRDKAKAHGRQNLIEGRVQGHERVLVIEDLISTGGSSLKAVEAVREAGCQVVGILSIFTYQFDHATEAFNKAGCPADSLTDYTTLVQEAIASGYVKNDDLELLSAWRAAPENWMHQQS